MNLIPTRLHGMLDYLVGALLIAAPWIFGFADDGGAKMWVPIILGAGAIVYSAMTDYEFGLIRVISMPVHLALDFGSGVFLAASPWLFSFADEVKWPHLIVGLVEIVAAVATRRHPEDKETYDPARTSGTGGTRMAS